MQRDNTEEPPIDVQRITVDPHHHLWDFGPVPGAASEPKPFLLQQMVQVINEAGHRVTRTVYVECHAMYRREGPEEMRPVGETEFANGMAAMSASGRYGDSRIASAIVGTANLRLGERVERVLEAQIAAGNGRLRGIRTTTAYAQTKLFGRPADPSLKGLMMDAGFRAGVRALSRFDLTLDVWCLHPQLAELADLASACPDVTIILDHLGTPVLGDPQSNAEVFATWRRGIVELARRPNVRIKLGGLGMNLQAPIGERGSARSTELASEWRPSSRLPSRRSVRHARCSKATFPLIPPVATGQSGTASSASRRPFRKTRRRSSSVVRRTRCIGCTDRRSCEPQKRSPTICSLFAHSARARSGSIA